MGKPDNPDQFGLIQNNDLEIYVAPDIWQKLGPQTEKILIALEGYGRFWLWLDEINSNRNGDDENDYKCTDSS